MTGKVMSTIRSLKTRRVSTSFGVERNSYILFYEMFKKANREVEVVDAGRVLVEMRIISRRRRYSLTLTLIIGLA